MALPLPLGKQYLISYRKLPKDYEMPSMEAAQDHYSLCFIINGDRKIITPNMTYTMHAGCVAAMPPFLYHKTVPASDEEYESILLKFSPEFVKTFSDRVGSHVLEQIYKTPAKHFTPEDEKRIFFLASEMLKAANEGVELPKGTQAAESYHTFRFQCLLYTTLLFIYERGINDDDANIHNTPLSQSVMDAVYYMEKNYMKDLRIKDVADVSGYSVFYFSRLFQTQLGSSFSEYLTNIRLKHVQNDLLTTKKSITEIALENGFSYPGNMTNSFRKAFGITPLQYRKQAE